MSDVSLWPRPGCCPFRLNLQHILGSRCPWPPLARWEISWADTEVEVALYRLPKHVILSPVALGSA